MHFTLKLLGSAALVTAVLAVATPAQAQPLPPGNYRSTCSNLDIRPSRGGGATLYGTCRDVLGLPHQTSVQVPCNGDVVNVNGQLSCPGGYAGGDGGYGGDGGGYGDGSGYGDGGGYGGPGRGPGGFGPRASFYTNPGFRGGRLDVRGPIPDLSDEGFEDTISSIRISSGTWQVCTDIYFAGRCQIVNGSYDNLPRYLNDRIESVRPIGGH